MQADPKRTAAAVLSLVPSGDEGGGDAATDDVESVDTEAAALEAAATEAFTALKADDAAGFARAFRAAVEAVKE